jgi:DNA-binding response OmpR family regulator
MNSLVPQILVTEDHADTRELLAFVLAKHNCKVILADNTEQALYLAQTNSFDLYLLDNWIVGESGIVLCKKLRELGSTTPILFYSGAAFESDKQEAFASGAQAYLVKPVDIDELVETVRRLIAQAKQNLQH